MWKIPQSELFGTKTEGADIPGWVLKQDENTIKDVLERGNSIARTVISVLENQLQLPPGTMTKLHRLTDDSGDFLRILKYAGDDSDNKNPPEGFPPHRDATSITMVFTWLGGLQIPTPNAKVEGFAVRDEDWRWVRPEPGFAIVNVGDAMSIFTNNVLKSGIHRVVKAPGEQRPHNRISVTLATRPENNTLMKPFQSAIIPHCEMDGEPMSSLEWGHSVVSGIQKRAVTRGARDLDNT
jgi:isopenicillin N synthase-like dioxygenase